jgi:hypothetical protein
MFANAALVVIESQSHAMFNPLFSHRYTPSTQLHRFDTQTRHISAFLEARFSV